MEFAACVEIVPRPKAVRAADADVELVPPLATDMGVVIVTVGLPKAFNEAADASTPVAKVVPSVTDAVMVPISTPRPSVSDIDCYLQPCSAETLACLRSRRFALRRSNRDA